MKKPVQISMPSPCPVKMEMMKPTVDGWFCKGCQKTVFDFTEYSDEQLAQVYENKEGRCGMFLNSQINRELVIPKKSRTVWIAATAALSFFTLGINKLNAQIPIPKQQFIPANDSVFTIQTEAQTRMFNGHVGNNRKNVKGAKVKVVGTSRETYTDEKGNFTIEAKVGDVLKVTGRGFKSEKVVVLDEPMQFIGIVYRRKSKNGPISPGYF